MRASQPPAALWENVFVLPALAATYGIDSLIDQALNFFVSPFAATLIYLLGLTVLVEWITEREGTSARQGTRVATGEPWVRHPWRQPTAPTPPTGTIATRSKEATG